uniref:OmpA-like domain-containing protein n=1 Tax=candidate division WOR-3 bacterium TaxID=2052148 RepID=A0A7C4GGX4_UNCW3
MDTMKSIFSSIAWILFFALAAAVLVFYNFAYLPQASRITRLREEIAMWTRQVEELTDSLRQHRPGSDTAFRVSFSFDELFFSPESLTVVSQSEAMLRSYLPTLNATPGTIEISGHTDARTTPEKLRDRFPSAWEYGAAAAGRIARLFISWGVPAERIRVVSCADTRPAVAKTDPASRALNRRVEVIVRPQ